MVMSALDTVLSTTNPRVGIFLRLDLPDDPQRLWLGVGDCKAGIDADDGSGAIYHGLGELLGIPQFQQLVNGTAERVEFRLSGVSASVVALANEHADEVKNVPLLVGIGVFDTDWQLLAAPTWLRRFIVDYLSVSQEPTDKEPVRTLSLSARTFLTGRRRPGRVFYTDRDQQALSPGDRFCERVAIYSQEVMKIWPRY